MTALEYFRRVAPEYAAMSDLDVTVWLTMAESLISVDQLGSERAAMATAYYAAHLIKSSEQAASGAAGAVVSEREGDLARTYAEPSTGDAWNAYFRMYKSITAGLGVGIMTRVGAI